MTGLDLNPDELRSFSDQVRRASNRAFALQGYAGRTCRTTTGLDGLLSVLRSPVELVADANQSVLLKTNDGLWQTHLDIRSAAYDAESSDAEAAAQISALFPEAPDFFPDRIGPVGSMYGYDDHWDSHPVEPEDASTELTAEGIDPGGVLGAIDWVWEQVTGESLIAAIIDPIVGDPGRLAWLSEAYSELGDATYAVAWNLRSGTFNVGPHWNGDSGRAFELHMFRWHMGLGGLGDAQHLVSGILSEAYDLVFEGVNMVLEKINSLINRLAEFAARKAAPVIGWFTTAWDVFTGDLWDKITEFIDDVQRIKDQIQDLKDACEDFKADIEDAKATVEALLDGARDPLGALRDLAGDAQSQIFNVEGRDDWEPSLTSAGRAALLPI